MRCCPIDSSADGYCVIATIACGVFDRVWDAETGKEKAKLEGHSGPVSSVAISSDGKTIVSGSWDKTIR